MQKITIYRKPRGVNLFEARPVVETFVKAGRPLGQSSPSVGFGMFRSRQRDLIPKDGQVERLSLHSTHE